MAITKVVNIKVDEQGTQEAKQKMDGLNQSTNTNTQATQTNAIAQKTLKTQVREATIELQNMVNMYGETSEQAVKSAKALANLKDQMQFASDLTKQFNPDQKLKALAASTQVAGTGLQGVTSGMALFGDSSESTEKALLRVQSAMSFADALGNLSNVTDQWQILKTTIAQSTIVQKANNTATALAGTIQKAFTGAVNTTTTGFKGLKLAIAGTGIGLLVLAVGSLIENFDKVKRVVFAFVPSLEKVGEKIMSIVNAVTDFFGITSKAERALSDQKAWAEKAIKQNEKYLKTNEHQLTEAQKKEIERNNQHFERLASGEYTKEQSLKILRNQANKDRQDAIDEANAKELERQKELQDKLREARQEAIAKQKEKLAEEKRIKEEAIQKEIEAEKQRNEAILNMNMEYAKKIEDLEAETELEKIELEKKRAIEELDRLKATEEEKKNTILYYDQLTKNELDKQKQEQFELDLEKKEVDAENEQLAFEDRLALLNEREQLINESTLLSQKQKDELLLSNTKARTDLEVQFETKKDEAIAKSKENFNSIISSLEATNLAKSKVGQALGKTLALTQIGIDSARALSKATELANAEGIATQLAFPLVPGAGTIARVLSYTTTALSVASNISRAKQLLSSGGGGDTGGGASSGGSTPPAPPSFNLVQGTGTNQIAESLATDRQPLKAYVVASEVSTQQALERNIVSNASL